MAENNLSLQLKGRILGALIRDARLKAGKSTQEFASWIGVSSEDYELYELGGQAISLPELELVAKNLQTPIERFFGKAPSPESEKQKQKIDPADQIKLRQRIVGAKLRQTRLENQISLEHLSELMDIEEKDLEAFELGVKPVPIPVLEKLCDSLGCSLADFLEPKKSDEKPKTATGVEADFQNLPADLQAFVVKPVNRPYLEIAAKLSQMPVDQLRTVAEALLEITY